AGQSSAQQGEGYPVGPGLTRLQEKDGYLTLPADPKVQALVYVAAFAPDAGQSSAQQGEGYPVGPGLTRLQEKDGYLTLPA
ncbi:hypothetical protein C7E25_23910, partial [Stenotrophomonas maltophilia]